MNELKFNSAVCTSVEQSQHLLDLGLKPETADMILIKELAYDEVTHCTYDAVTYMIRPIDYLEGEEHRGHIPAWSLHRLLSIGVNGDYMGLWNININTDTVGDLFEQLIRLIEWTIKDGLFNKEYLKQ
jgi:hypothetical protein